MQDSQHPTSLSQGAAESAQSPEQGYTAAAVESAAQRYWGEQHAYEVKEDASKPKFYCLSMLHGPRAQLHHR
jgi:leucyl-tRNA synthetase